MSNRTEPVLAALVCAAAVMACGGGEAEPTRAARLEIGSSTSEAVTMVPSGAVQTQWLTLRNTGSAAARQVLLAVEPGTHVLHLPLSCEGTPSPCAVRADGSLAIAELAPGASLRVQQRLRIAPGFSGRVSNNWLMRTAAEAGADSWRQEIQAYAADLSVAVKAPVTSIEAGDEVLSHELTLSNDGQDEARSVEWRQMAASGMDWLGASCSATSGAQCPAELNERINLERLPKGAMLTLVARYRPRQIDREETNFLSSDVFAPGEMSPANNRAEHRQANVNNEEGRYVVFGLDGEQYRLAYSLWGERSLRFTNERIDRRVNIMVDVTGHLWLRERDEVGVNPMLAGSLFPGVGLLTGALDLGTGRRPFLGGSHFVSQMTELEGRIYNLLGSKADKQGQSLDAFAWTAQFRNGAMEVCASAVPTAVAQCPEALLRRWDVAIVGEELELVDRGGEVRRLRAARTPSGPVLILSQRNAADASSEFWLGMPAVEASDDVDYGSGLAFSAETTFGNASGLAVPDFPEFRSVGPPESKVVEAGSAAGLPNAYFLFLHKYGDWCRLHDGQFKRTGVPALRAGTVAAAKQGATCWGGPSYHIRTKELRVLLGSKDGALVGRWFFAPEG
ncbi:hypothetical protein OOZ63_16590 [Paucibacter sp. PLA-PC-4]|uniref:hypothetical protein n=1 Tax=Paucibacter sp. PLA-PC-4 TaxID=2993655 RepID=UPI00224B79D7|nr:hypothetical protein [Paucibacter sp. PLA-PC-4]MCX2863450.1 hypothetical protein [Paucibacter sp. PLA-PC-4]